jgi:hypothetical protein
MEASGKYQNHIINGNLLECQFVGKWCSYYYYFNYHPPDYKIIEIKIRKIKI